MRSLSQRNRCLSWTFALALLPGAFGLILAAGAQDEVTVANLEERLESAETAADHQAIAAFYQRQAAEAQAQVSKHENMAQIYRNKALKVQRSANAMTGHCARLADSYRALAADLSALAKDHRSMAEQAE